MTKTVVCGIDATNASDRAVHLAVALTRRIGGQLHLVHAFDEPELDDRELDPAIRPAAEAMRERLRKRHSLEQARLDDLALQAAVSVESKVTIHPGRPWEALLQVAEEDDAEFLVVGPHVSAKGPLSKLGERLLGTTAQRVVRHSGRKVWVARGDVDAAVEGLNGDLRMVVGVDLKPGGQSALEQARGLKAEIHAVHALRDPFAAGDAPVDWGTLRERWKTQLDVRLKKEIPDASTATVKLGDSVDALVGVASTCQAHGIVVGSHSGGVLTRLLLGDTAERCLRRSPVPVLIVPPPSV